MTDPFLTGVADCVAVFSVLTADLTLAGVVAVTRDAVAPPVVLDAVVTLSACALDADVEDTLRPVLLDVAIPPRVDTLLVNALSAPVLCLEPCQLSSFIGPAWMWW